MRQHPHLVHPRQQQQLQQQPQQQNLMQPTRGPSQPYPQIQQQQLSHHSQSAYPRVTHQPTYHPPSQTIQLPTLPVQTSSITNTGNSLQQQPYTYQKPPPIGGVQRNLTIGGGGTIDPGPYGTHSITHKRPLGGHQYTTQQRSFSSSEEEMQGVFRPPVSSTEFDGKLYR